MDAVGLGTMASPLSPDVPAPPEPSRLNLLGGFSLNLGCHTIPLPASPSGWWHCSRCTERPCRRGYVAGLLWGDSTEARASGCLRSALWKLRVAGLRVVEAPW